MDNGPSIAAAFGSESQKESEELQRTHRNIFDWVQKEKRKVTEKDTFERLEQVEVEVEPMEVDIMDK